MFGDDAGLWERRLFHRFVETRTAHQNIWGSGSSARRIVRQLGAHDYRHLGVHRRQRLRDSTKLVHAMVARIDAHTARSERLDQRGHNYLILERPPFRDASFDPPWLRGWRRHSGVEQVVDPPRTELRWI